MSNQISNISVYIPHVFPNFTREDVKEVFENNKIGQVSRVDFVSKMGQDGKLYNAAYIHFDFWCDTIANRNFQARVCDPNKEAKIVYDEPWYWIVLENKGRKYIPGERKPRIILSDLTPQAVMSWAEVVEPKPVMPVTEVKVQEEPVCPKLFLEDLMTDEDMSALIEDIAECEQEDSEFKQLIVEMDECLATIEQEDQTLVSVDVRYLQVLEQENTELHNQMYNLNFQIQELTNSLYAEQNKTNALAEAVRLVSISK